MKRSTRYQIAKFNRASMEARFFVIRKARGLWWEIRHPAQMAAARELLRRDRAASTFFA